MDYPLKPLLLQSGPRLGLFITLFQTRSYPCAQQISLFFTLQATQVRPLRLKDALYIACYGVPGVLPSERRSDKLLSLSPDCSSSGPPVTDEEGGLCVIHDPWDSTGNPVRRPSPSCGARSEISVTPKELHQTLYVCNMKVQYAFHTMENYLYEGRKYFCLHNWKIQFEVTSGDIIVKGIININISIT